VRHDEHHLRRVSGKYGLQDSGEASLRYDDERLRRMRHQRSVRDERRPGCRMRHNGQSVRRVQHCCRLQERGAPGVQRRASRLRAAVALSLGLRDPTRVSALREPFTWGPGRRISRREGGGH
jgi:hypothetical protein